MNLIHPQFDFHIINTMEDECAATDSASHSIYNSWQHQQPDDNRAWFTTADNTSSQMTIVLGLQQLWSDAKSNRKPC